MTLARPVTVEEPEVSLRLGSEVSLGVRFVVGSGVCLQLGAKVSLWPGQESVAGLIQGSVCDKDRSHQDSVHQQGERLDELKAGLSCGRSWGDVSVE